MIRAAGFGLTAGILSGCLYALLSPKGDRSAVGNVSNEKNQKEVEEPETKREKNYQEPNTTASSHSPSPPPPKCVVILKEVTKDRFIHYLLRPAAALGASEVIWIGEMKAKATMGSKTPYGKAMRREATIPLKNLNSMFQVRRHLTSECERATSGLVIVGVSLEAACAIGNGRPDVQDLMNVDFTTLRPRRDHQEEEEEHDEQGRLQTPPHTIAFLFAGPTGKLTLEEAQSCDAIVAVKSPSTSTTTAAVDVWKEKQKYAASAAVGKEEDESSMAATEEDGDEALDPPINISALMAIVLHQFVVATPTQRDTRNNNAALSSVSTAGGGDEEKFFTRSKPRVG